MQEKIIRPVSGYVALMVWLVIVTGVVYSATSGQFWWMVGLAVLALFMAVVCPECLSRVQHLQR